MSIERTQRSERSGAQAASPSIQSTAVRRAREAIQTRLRDGSLATVAGGLCLARAVTIVRQRTVRGTLLGLAGLALVGLGVRQGRQARREERIETGADARRDEAGRKQVDDEAFAERSRDLGAERTADETRSVSQSESEPNPRGMTDREDVPDHSGDVHFVDGREPETHRATHLEEGDAHDTRLHPEDADEPTEVDLSEAAMADEASEAAGPHSEQAYPAREGTDPEPTSEAAPERVGQGAVAPADPDDAVSGDGGAGEANEGDDASPDEATRGESTSESADE